MTLSTGLSGTVTGIPRATKGVKGVGGEHGVQKDLSGRLYPYYGVGGDGRYTSVTVSKSPKLKYKPYGISVDANGMSVILVL